ncbi:hypothetical protein ABPG77_002459 [Micractinium sp. CCAP 211/92]
MADGDEPQKSAGLICSVCSAEIDTEVEYIEALCNACGRHAFHIDCVAPLMLRIHHDSTRAMERARRMVATRPAYYMAQQRMQCPVALTNRSVTCGGRIVDADMVKPVKALPPPGLPVPAPHSKKKKAGGGRALAAAQPSGRGRAAPAPAPAEPTQKQQRAAAAAFRASAAPDYARESAAGSSGVGGGSGAGATTHAGGAQPCGAKLRFPPGHRPVELQRCQDFDDCGECFIHRCPRCHGDEELLQREREWAAQQAAKQREKRRQELARHEAAVTARAEQSEWEEQVAARERERLELEESYLRMGDAPLRLMKDYKRSICVASLVDMGFSPTAAAAATEATGCDISAAAALVSEGGLIMGSKPVSVTGEAQDLLAYADSLGLGLQDVEIALVLAGGSWDDARTQLHDQAEAAAVAASMAEAEEARRADAAAGSREEAELQAALQASSSSAALAYNTARTAAAAAAAAPRAATSARLIGVWERPQQDYTRAKPHWSRVKPDMRSVALSVTVRRLAAASEILAGARAGAAAAACGRSLQAAASAAGGPTVGAAAVAALPAAACLQPWAGFASAAATRSGHSVAQKVLAAPQDSVGPDVIEAVSQLDPAGVPSVARAAAVTGIHDPAFLEALADAAIKSMSHLSAADICSVVESFSDLDCYNIEFKDATADIVLQRLVEFSGDMLGHLLRAFGDMNYYDDELLEGVVGHVAANPGKFSAENIADVVRRRRRARRMLRAACACDVSDHEAP